MFKEIIYLLANKNPIDMNCEISLRSHLNAHCLAKPAGYVNICASIWAGEGKIDSSSRDLKNVLLLSYVTHSTTIIARRQNNNYSKYYVRTQAAC